ncbi:MAG: hypothetical protein JWM11_2553 [Planctomycetaceae bacterium]|nr:hypothetical protein [Planctomycetaceae bacterium]
MHEITLQLRFTSHAQRRECARFIPSENPREWLSELISWSIPLDKVRLCPLPRSRSDNVCAGVLAIYESNSAPKLTGRSQGYGQIANRLYLPVEAALSLEPADQEWKSLIGSETAAYVWHPYLGLVAFEAHEVLHVADLLARPCTAPIANPPPESPPHDWGLAQTGVSFPNRITALRSELPPSFEMMLADGRDNIGTQARPLPGEGFSSGPLGALGKAVAAGVLLPFALAGKLLSQLASRPAGGANAGPQPPQQAGMFSKLFGWLKSKFSSDPPKPVTPPSAVPAPGSTSGAGLLGAAMTGFNQLMQWTADLFDARQRELNRLLKLLDENPDEGLKFALPMGGEPGRGLAEPSAALVSRMVDFSLKGHGSGPADVWNMPPKTQFELARRYRELAAREIQLGRYRRAAYIFAQLLGDQNAAAQALVTGRFYREAAVLYRDKLNRPLDAANCLVKGGLLQEAIPFYRQAGQLETVGDLYQRLEERELAESAFREAASTALQRKDFLDAARILQVKVQSDLEALTVLDAGWPDSNQARRCLEAAFEMRGLLGQHEEVLQKIAVLRKSELAAQRCVDALEVLVTVATQSPHTASRTAAADAVRVKASVALTADRVTYRQQITAAVSRLAPEDRLLNRDCNRATLATGSRRKRTNAGEDKKLTGPDKRPAHSVRLLRTYRLPVGVKWNAACATDRSFFVAGWLNGQEVFVTRGVWNDLQAEVDSVSTHPHTMMPPGLMVCWDSNTNSLMVANPGGCVFPRTRFAPTDLSPAPEFVETPAWIPSSMSALAISPHGTCYTFQLLEMLLKSHPLHRNPAEVNYLHSQSLDTTFDPDEVFPMVAQDDVCYLGVHKCLFETRAGRQFNTETYLRPVRGLAVSPPQTYRRLAVSFDRGGYLYWSENNLKQFQWFGDDLDSPMAVFLRDGRLILLGEASNQRVWRVCTTSEKAVQTVFEVPCDVTGDVVALLLAAAPNQVGLVTADGHVRVFAFS